MSHFRARHINGGEDQDSTLKKEAGESSMVSSSISDGIFGTNVTGELFSKFQNILCMLLFS
jgi:hypothetical protein